MRSLTFKENRVDSPVTLARDERDALRAAVPKMQMTPMTGSSVQYEITAGSVVGGVTLLDRIVVEIQPKTPIERIVFMVSYALDPAAFKGSDYAFASASTLVEAMVLAFGAHMERAFRHGILHGYRTEEDALPVIRGRVRFDEQIRRRYGRFPPAEVSFEEFTEDITENRLIRAALARLHGLTLRLRKSSDTIRANEAILQRVASVEFDALSLPRISYNRLNQHYRGAVEMAKLVLRSTSFEVGQGSVVSNAFLVDDLCVPKLRSCRPTRGSSTAGICFPKPRPAGVLP